MKKNWTDPSTDRGGDGLGGDRSDSDGFGMATDLAATDPAAANVAATNVAATDHRATLIHCTM
jgi:hypothetical protein